MSAYVKKADNVNSEMQLPEHYPQYASYNVRKKSDEHKYKKEVEINRHLY
jgi:hypothetical protein